MRYIKGLDVLRALAILLGIASTFILQLYYGKYSYYLLMPCVTAFGIGALYAYTESYQRYHKLIIISVKVLLPICILLLLIHQIVFNLSWIRVVNSLISLATIMYVTIQNYNLFTYRILNNRIQVNVGKISYGIYLYHLKLPDYYYQFVGFLQKKIQIGPSVLKIITVPPTAYLIHVLLLFIISVLSYKIIESGFLKLKKHFEYTTTRKIITEPVGLI